MSRRNGIAMVFAAGLALATPGVVSAQGIWDAPKGPVTVYPLHCRGGAGFEFRTLATRTTSGGERVAMALVFAPAASAAGSRSQGLTPGTCAWLDRPLVPAEPREVRFVAPAFLQFGQGVLDTSPTTAQRTADVRSIAAYLQYPDHYWSFTAYNTGNGYFGTTAHGYWIDHSSLPQGKHVEANQLPPRDASWFVVAGMSGGIVPTIAEVSIDSAGNLTATHSNADVKCSAKVHFMTVQGIERAVARSQAPQWKKSYAAKDNPNGCCDMVGATLRVEQRPGKQPPVTYETLWYENKAAPEGVTALFKLVWDLRKTCAFGM
jgi:hypothetical protein